ncbi:MAG: SDR family oxidoreductase [Mycoplasmatales bacterium]
MKKLIVITGASSGFGMEMAKLFAAQGHPLLLLARRVELIEQMIKEENLKNALAAQVDVTDYSTFQAAITKAQTLYGPVDLLINNAGVMLLGSITNQNPQEWQTMLDVNVKGVLNGMQIVINDMLKNNTGTIINVSSIAGRKTFQNHAAYCATKYGVHALTETIREEVSAHNVRVLTIAPGAAETELLEHTTSQQIKADYYAWKDSMGGKSMDALHVAQSALFMYQMPQDVSIREIVLAHTKQDS